MSLETYKRITIPSLSACKHHHWPPITFIAVFVTALELEVYPRSRRGFQHVQKHRSLERVPCRHLGWNANVNQAGGKRDAHYAYFNILAVLGWMASCVWCVSIEYLCDPVQEPCRSKAHGTCNWVGPHHHHTRTDCVECRIPLGNSYIGCISVVRLSLVRSQR